MHSTPPPTSQPTPSDTRLPFHPHRPKTHPPRAPQTYHYKGKLVGLYHDATGAPTAALKQVEEAAEEGKRIKEEKAKEVQRYTACSVKYTSVEGGLGATPTLGGWEPGGRGPRWGLQVACAAWGIEVGAAGEAACLLLHDATYMEAWGQGCGMGGL